MLCLSRDIRFLPRGIASTSVGSINALAAAERSIRGFAKLRATWLGLQNVNDMYELQPWVAHRDAVDLLRGQGLSLGEIFKGCARRSLHPDQALVAAIDPLAGIRSVT